MLLLQLGGPGAQISPSPYPEDENPFLKILRQMYQATPSLPISPETRTGISDLFSKASALGGRLLRGGGNVNIGTGFGLEGRLSDAPFPDPSVQSRPEQPPPPPSVGLTPGSPEWKEKFGAMQATPTPSGITAPPQGPATLSDKDRTDAEAAVGSQEAGGPPLSEIRGGRYVPEKDEPLTAPTPGQRRDFSSRWQDIQRMSEKPQGFSNAFFDAWFRTFSPEVAQARDRERDLKIQAAERALLSEQQMSDEDFRRQEEMKEKIYLSQYGQRLGKEKYKDIKTGAEGYFAPMELATLSRQDEQMELANRQLDRQIRAMEMAGELSKAQADMYRASAAKANSAEEISMLMTIAANERAKLQAGGPLADTSGMDMINQLLLSRIPGAGAVTPPQTTAPTLTPTAQKALAAGVPAQFGPLWDDMVRNKDKTKNWLLSGDGKSLPDPVKTLILQLLNQPSE